MSFRRTASLILLLCVYANAQSKDEVLARMDRSARDFKSFAAKVKEIDYTKVLNEKDERSGLIRMTRAKEATGIIEFADPNPQTVFISGKTVKIYKPKA